MGYLTEKIVLSQFLLPVIIFASSFACKKDTYLPGTTDGQAIVKDIKVSGSENAYNFAATLKSPDQGCEQYAN